MDLDRHSRHSWVLILASERARRYKVVIVDETETSVGAKVRQRQSEGNWKKAVAKGRTVPLAFSICFAPLSVSLVSAKVVTYVVDTNLCF